MHGFDQWLATERSAPTATLNCGCFNQSSCVKGHYSQETFPCTNYWRAAKPHGITNETSLEDGDDSLYIMDHVEEFIRSAAANNTPFFVYIPLHAVHIKYIAVEPYKTMYLKKGYDMNHTDYYGAVTAMDEQVGRLRNLLAELQVNKNTLLWFASDNGPESHTPGMTNGLRGRKRDLTEGGIRVPGIIEWPAKVAKNRVVQTPIMSSDLLPTVLDILNLTMPDKRPVDGVSVLPLIEERTEERPRPAGFAYKVPGNFNGTYHTAWVDNRVSNLLNVYLS
jgi:arylsulfatase A-like enzyme